MRARIIQIGNSRGVRIPKLLLEQSGLGEHIEIEVREGHLIISPLRQVRAGWAEEFAAMAACGDDALLDADVTPAARWDEEEWEWE